MKLLRKNIEKEKDFTARIFNVLQSAVAKWETSESKPRVDKLISISTILECSIEKVITAVQMSE